MHPLLKVISSVINNTNEKVIVDKDLYYMARKSHMEVFLCDCIDPSTDDRIKQALRKSLFAEMNRDQKQKEEQKVITKLFNDNQIEFMFLKGFSLKKYYPETYYRFMCDMDLLVKEKDLKKASKLLLSLGYTKEKGSDHDIAFSKEPIFHLELHFILIPRKEHGRKYFYPAFNHIERIDSNSCEMKFKCLEDEYIFNFFHTLKHFEEQGIGIRNFLDLYLFIIHNPSLNFEYIHNSYKYTKYEKDCYLLENFVLTLLDDNDDNSELIQEVINDGIFGTIQKRYQKEKGKHNSTFLWLLKHAFPGFQTMKVYYPFLRHWYLVLVLPFCYIHRLCYFILKPKLLKEKLKEKSIN